MDGGKQRSSLVSIVMLRRSIQWLDSSFCLEHSKLVSLHMFIYVHHVFIVCILTVLLIQESLGGVLRGMPLPLFGRSTCLGREAGFGLNWSANASFWMVLGKVPKRESHTEIKRILELDRLLSLGKNQRGKSWVTPKCYRIWHVDPQVRVEERFREFITLLIFYIMEITLLC